VEDRDMVKRIRAAIMIGCALAACLGLGALMTPIHAQEPAQRSPSEGIKVHGDWVVEVHEPDGTLVSRQAFRNALEVGDKGDYALALALARRLTLVGWFVQLASGAHALQGPCSSGTRCHLVEGTDFSVSVLKAVPAALILSGQVTVGSGGPIGWVGTRLRFVTADGEEEGYSFSGHALTTPIQTTAGQVVQFTVTFTFS